MLDSSTNNSSHHNLSKLESSNQKDLDLVTLSHKKQSWRVDSEIEPFSQWHVLIAMVWTFIMLLVMSLSGLTWWQWFLVIAVTAGCLFFYQLRRLPILHLTQSVINEQGYAPWLIYVQDFYSHAKNSDLTKLQAWQGDLTSTYVNRYLVLLSFDIVEPLPLSVTVSIWRDQVSRETWRQLQVLSRL